MSTQPPDVTWTIATDTTPTATEITANGLAAPTPTLVRGDTTTLPFVFFESADPALGDYQARYRALRDYLDFASDRSIRTGTTHRGVPWFRERLPESAPVDSLVVAIRPAADPSLAFWGAIVGGEDSSQPAAALRRLDVEVFVLAGLAEYADRDALTADLGDDVFTTGQ